MVATTLEKPVPEAATEPPAITALRDTLDAHAGKLPEHGQSPRKLTGGEVLFNRVVYTGIGFGVNEVSSLWITDQFKHGSPKWWLGGKPFSKEGFGAASNFIAKKFNMPVAKASNTLLMATLLSGGTLLVLPMRMLEEKKIFWTKKANHFLDWVKGSDMTEAQVQMRDEDVEKAIACSPQQNWKSLLVGRVAAMFSSWATGTFLVGPERNERIMKWSERTLTSGANAVGLSKMAKTDTFKRYAQLTGVETYSCAMSSIVLEMVSKLFAKRGTEVHDPEICQAYQEKEKAAAAPVSTSNESDDGRARINPEQFRKAEILPKSASYSTQVKSEKESASQTLAV